MTVPNIIHFIYPVWNSTRPLSYMNYVAVKRAAMIHRPDKIKFWINKEPEPSRYWDMIKPLVEINYVPMDGKFRGVDIPYPQLQSDVTRLEILKHQGGIYMDTDMLLLQDLHPFRDETFEMCVEPGGTSACNALIIAEPDAPFIDLWLDRMADSLKGDVWAHGGVVLPFEIWKEHPDKCAMNPSYYFCPFDLKQDLLFATDPETITMAMSKSHYSYAIHGFETFFRNVRFDASPEWKADCLFMRLAKETENV